MKTTWLILALGLCLPSFAASPPERINYQGVLRDAAGNPADGSYPMVFRFYGNGAGACDCGGPTGGPGCSDATCEADVCAIDAFCCTDWDQICANYAEQVASCQACIADEEVLIEDHAGATQPIDVTGGLFNVALGTGGMTDGSGAGTYATLGELFRDYDVVYVETVVSGETLSPRVRVEASAYTQNARHLDGKPASEFIDTSSTAQTKSGPLTVGPLTVSGPIGAISFDYGQIITSVTGWGITSSDADQGSILANVGGDMSFVSDSGVYGFVPELGSTEGTVLDLAPGFAGGELTLGNVNTLTGGGSADALHTHSAFAGGLSLNDGSAGTPALRFSNDPDTGIFGQPGTLSLAVDGTETVLFDPVGNARLTGGLFVGCGDLLSCGIESQLVFDTVTNTGLATSGTFAVDGGELYLATDESLSWTGSRFALSNDLEFESSGSTVRSISNSYDIEMRKDDVDATSVAWFRWYTNGTREQMRIEDGNDAATSFDGVVNANGLDYAEAFKITDTTLEAGDVVSLSLTQAEYIDRAAAPYAAQLLGVISERPGFLTGSSFDAEEEADAAIVALRNEARATGDLELAKQYTQQLIELKEQHQRPVALAGRVPVKVDGSYGPIAAGDFLTSSPTPGHAMPMTQAGRTIGVAMEPWNGPGRGKILAFINPGFHDPSPGSGSSHTSSVDSEPEAPALVAAPAPVQETQAVAGNLQVVLDSGADESSRFSIFRDGDDSGALGAEVLRVDESGNVWAEGSFRPKGMDLAEYFVLSAPAEAGDVLVADRDRPGFYMPSLGAADSAVVGVVSEEPGVLLGSNVTRIAAADADLARRLDDARALGDGELEAELWADLEAKFEASHAPVALSGTVRVKVDAGFGTIRVGDALTSSPTPGHAMRSDDVRPLTVIGKALEPLEAGTGTIRMLVLMR